MNHKRIFFLLFGLFALTTVCLAETAEHEYHPIDDWMYYWRMHVESIIMTGVCVLEYFYLRKEAEKRKLKVQLMIVLGAVGVIFFNDIFVANFRMLYPMAWAVAFVYPFCYKNLGRIKTGLILYAGLLIMLAVIILDPMHYISGTWNFLKTMVVSFVPYLILVHWELLPAICPHCNYFANHEKVSEDVISQEQKEEHHNYRQYEGSKTEEQFGQKITTYYYSDHHEVENVLYKRIHLTRLCANCNQLIHGHYTDREVLSRRSD